MVIQTQKLCKDFIDPNGRRTEVLSNINLTVNKGEFVTFFGPNGCGKSTLMSLITGVEKPSRGELRMSSASLEIGYVFQDYKSSLLPWRTVFDNIAMPLIWRGLKRQLARQKILELVKTFRLNVSLGAYPFMLSGGQAQLVCLLRSLVVNPDILILDEPTSALDYLNSMNLLMELQEIWMELGFSALFISHNIEEALFLGDRLILLSSKPTTVVDKIEIPLPRPRRLSVFTDPEFVRLKQRALESLYPMLLPSTV